MSTGDASGTPSSGSCPVATAGESHVVILIAHGSRAEESNENHRRLVAEVAARSGAAVRAAFLELAEPSIGDAVEAAATNGATSIRLIPHFLGPGRHTTRDIPAAIAEASQRHPSVVITVSDHVGAHPALVDLVLDLLTT